MKNKELKWTERPFTWGGYAKLCVISGIISIIAIIIEFACIFGWFTKGYEKLVSIKNRIFHKKDSNKTVENEEEES